MPHITFLSHSVSLYIMHKTAIWLHVLHTNWQLPNPGYLHVCVLNVSVGVSGRVCGGLTCVLVGFAWTFNATLAKNSLPFVYLIKLIKWTKPAICSSLPPHFPLPSFLVTHTTPTPLSICLPTHTHTCIINCRLCSASSSVDYEHIEPCGHIVTAIPSSFFGQACRQAAYVGQQIF